MYNFASNKSKLARAIGALPLGASEERVKAEYIRIGGLLSNESNTMNEEEVIVETPEVIIDTSVEAPETPVEEVSEPIEESPEEVA